MLTNTKSTENQAKSGNLVKPVLPAVLFETDLIHLPLQKITEYLDYYLVETSVGGSTPLAIFNKFKITKSGILWGYWGGKYRDAIAGRFFDGSKKYEFEVISECQLKVLKK